MKNKIWNTLLHWMVSLGQKKKEKRKKERNNYSYFHNLRPSSFLHCSFFFSFPFFTAVDQLIIDFSTYGFGYIIVHESNKCFLLTSMKAVIERYNQLKEENEQLLNPPSEVKVYYKCQLM